MARVNDRKSLEVEEQHTLLVGQPVSSLNRFSWFNPSECTWKD